MSNYVLSEISFPSVDGKNTVHGEIYTPASGEIRGVVQLAHGMIDYVGRYTFLAEFLTSKGYVFAGNDHLGHGKTAANDSDFGYFADDDGVVILPQHYIHPVLGQVVEHIFFHRQIPGRIGGGQVKKIKHREVLSVRCTAQLIVKNENYR